MTMPLDPAPLARLAAEAIDELEREHGDGAVLVDAVILTEVEIPDGDEHYSQVQAFPLQGRNTAAIGIVERGRMALTDPDD
jgi:hypothetical protein